MPEPEDKAKDTRRAEQHDGQQVAVVTTNMPDSAVGTTTDGDTTIGDTTAGNTTANDITANDTTFRITASNTTAGNTTIDDTTTGDTTDEPSTASRSGDHVHPPGEQFERTHRTQELVQTSERLASASSNSYQAWRSQADLLLQAIKQLEKREIDADETVTLLGVRLIEEDLRDAAEQALRHCAHFAGTFDERIALIDEANTVRRTTWF